MKTCPPRVRTAAPRARGGEEGSAASMRASLALMSHLPGAMDAVEPEGDGPGRNPGRSRLAVGGQEVGDTPRDETGRSLTACS